MSQHYKNIYFPDHPGLSAKERNLTLAFGDRDLPVFELIKGLSSQELREALGNFTYKSLREQAELEQLTVNTYCLRSLRSRFSPSNQDLRQQTLPGINNDSSFVIDPLQATFKGGQAEPLHDWYPYLEGYSPQFVRQVLRDFAPLANRILDPFAGTGTTPLTAAGLGHQAFYCEVNPVLQHLVEVKSAALSLDENTRRQYVSELEECAKKLRSLLKSVEPDDDLFLSYGQVFGNSVFFEDSNLEAVLRFRSLIDKVACSSPLISKFLTVAAVATLIPASHLIRRGDVRYKTPKERARYRVDFFDAIQQKLQQISQDLLRLEGLNKQPELICEDAREIDKIAPLFVDAVVTSPPYLNGTNYFRNTKLELWFLRCLRTADDLSGFRYKAVTAGINDVTVAKCRGDLSPGVSDVVEALQRSAYDSRIPRMVASYFSEMGEIFCALRNHLSESAVAIIDIGDSSYGSIHVPTDTLLTGILTSLGFKARKQITLRKRLSRSGAPLRQVLLIFDWHKPARTLKQERLESPVWFDAWRRFKAELPHQQGVYRKRNWGHPLHSLCSYQGKMKPSLAAYLVETFLPSKGKLLDPFAGVGTIPFEAALRGQDSYAFEISPAAYCISAAKLSVTDWNECQPILDDLARYVTRNNPTQSELDAAERIHFNGQLSTYFERRTFHEILLARRFFKLNPYRSGSGALVLACLLHILHGNRPYALSRRSHPITPFAPTGKIEYRALIPRLKEKVLRSLEAARDENFVPGKIFVQDATSWWPQEVDNIDAVITSPPFFDSTRFYLSNWMRLWFCGWEAEDFRTQPLSFVDEQQKRTFDVYAPIFRQARERLKANGVLVLHLGKSRKCDMAEQLAKVASKWFRVADLFSEEVMHCESHGIRDKGTVTSHQFLILQ